MIRSFYSDTGEKSAAYALLRLAVEQVFGTPMPDIEKTASGKPFFPSRPDIHFSVSHSKRHVLVTVGTAPCGCDIEDERPYREETARRVSSTEELAAFSFLDLWTLKESYVKLKGNFERNIRDIVFSRDRSRIIPPEEGLFARLAGISGVHAAIICEGEMPDEPIFIPTSQLNA